MSALKPAAASADPGFLVVPAVRDRAAAPADTVFPAARAVRAYVLVSVLLAGVAGCDAVYPEVVVVNRTAEQVQIRNISFNGCKWDTVLAFGEATSPGRCLPGEDRAHFEMLDAQEYCLDRLEGGAGEGTSTCEGKEADPGPDPGLSDPVPTWFNYQTVTVRHVDYGEFHVIEVTLGDIEQDFSVPGPYGH